MEWVIRGAGDLTLRMPKGIRSMEFPDPREDPKSRSLHGGSYKALLVYKYRAPN